MTSAASEQVLLRVRTHPKVLFQPLIVQLVLVAAHVAVYLYFPASTGYQWVDEWGQLVVHGLIALVELTYVLIPALRWWNADFLVTDRRLEEHWGILYRHAREIPLDRIASVTTERGILDRLFGCGTLIFHDAALADGGARPRSGGSLSQRSGDGKVGVRFHDVPRVAEVRRVVDEARFGPRA